MYSIGHYNNLKVTGFTDHGALLDGGDEQILMPRKYVAPELKEGDVVRVFVYLDQDDRLVATTETPKAEVGQFAFLRVAWVNKYGAFMDWGLTKDLFVPFSQQMRHMKKDAAYLVYIYIDDQTGRIVGSNKLDKFVKTDGSHFHEGQEVEIQVWKQTDLGFKVVVDGAYYGLVYKNEIFQPLHIGDKMPAVVKHVRDDGRLDIALQEDGKRHIDDFSTQLLRALEDAGGFMPVGDHTPADEIYKNFNVSKKTFKKALGALYKQRRVEITPDGVRLTERGK